MSFKRTLTNLAADKKKLQKHTSEFKHSLDEVQKTINALNMKKKR